MRQGAVPYPRLSAGRIVRHMSNADNPDPQFGGHTPAFVWYDESNKVDSAAFKALLGRATSTFVPQACAMEQASHDRTYCVPCARCGRHPAECGQ